MNISGISDETRRQLFGKGKEARKTSASHKRPSLAPQMKTFQSLDENGIAEVPEISASTPVRCSLGEKDRPAGWQDLLERRLQKGPLTPITLTVNEDGKTVATSGALGTTSSALTTAEKANAVYRQKKSHNEQPKSLSSKHKIQDDLKRQSTLAAAAAAAASSPAYIASLKQQASQKNCKSSQKVSHSPSKTRAVQRLDLSPSAAQRLARLSKLSSPRETITTKHNTNCASSLPRAAEPPKALTSAQDLSPSTMRLIKRYTTPSKERVGTQQVPNPSFQPIKQEQKKESNKNLFKPIQQVSKPKNFLPISIDQELNAAQHQPSSDLYYERSPMCRLRSNSPARQMIRYQDFNCFDNQGVEVVYQISRDKSQKSNKLLLNSSISTLSSSLENKSQSTLSTKGPQNAKNNILGFKNKDFGGTGRSLLTGNIMPSLVTTSKPAAKPSKNDLAMKTALVAVNKDASAVAKKSVSKSATLAKKAACKSLLKHQRRADMINNHKHVTTLKAIGIDFENTYIIRKSAKKVTPQPTSPKKVKMPISKSSLSPTICNATIAQRYPKSKRREELYETVRRRRCLILQARRGVVAPTNKKPAYQRYCFLERQRLKQLGKYVEPSQVTKSHSIESNDSTVITMQSSSSNNSFDMMAQAVKRRNARLSLEGARHNQDLQQTSSTNTVTTMQSSSSSNKYEMMAQAVKRRNARLSLAGARQNQDLQQTLSTDSQGSRSSEKRTKALEKINRSKSKV